MAHKKGFSLIELMVVLAVLALIMTLTMVNGAWLNRMLIRSEIDKLQTICMYLQRCAQVSNEPQMLTFDVADRSYSFAGYHERLPAQLRFGLAAGVCGPPSKPTGHPESPITFKNQCITFSPHGIMQSGTVYVTDEQGQCTYALSSPIAHFSYMRTYRYDQGVWRPL